jgi:O-methyltransferase
MKFRYNPIERAGKIIYRRFFPIQKSDYTIGEVEDICSINLVPPKDLHDFFTKCVKMLREIKGEKIGDYLEFGVFNGSSISSMHQTGQELDLKETRYFGFDAFEGLPEKSEHEDDGVWKKGFYACSFEQMGECLRRKNIDIAAINWIKGWYENTLNSDTVNKYQLSNIGIVFIDCDTYSSSKSVLNFITPLLTSPAILCFDDWKLNDLDIKGMGEYQSFNEFLDNNPHIEVKEIKSYNRKSKSFLISPV